MRRLRNSLLLCAWLIASWLALAAPSASLTGQPLSAAAQGTTPESKQQSGGVSAKPAATPTRPPATPPDIQAILDKMTVADKVGQLFLVTFEGTDVSEDSDIATLVRDYRVGGVVLLPASGNFQSVPAEISPGLPGQPRTTAQVNVLSTPQQIVRLTNALQFLAMSSPRPITASTEITGTVVPTTTLVLTTTEPIPPTTAPKPTPKPRPASTSPPAPGTRIPLMIGLDWVGDDSSFLSGSGGFTPLASEMSIGATWTPQLAEKVGEVVGRELQSVGINLLLGPTLDVLEVPRPGNKGDLDTRAFGGDPFWVGQMGQSFIRGVQEGGQGSVLTAAKHFPGQGGSDRRPDDEVATVQKSVQQLRQIELAPFAAVTSGTDPRAPGTTAALMTSHIRYRGFQGNIRQLTPPISLAPQLQDLMALKEFADWRAGGGVLISDALGVPALRRYYDPALQKFPHRQIAQDAFLAGNDLLFLSRFALTDKWSDQLEAIKETILFFQDKYRTDNEFRARVDRSVERIIGLKLSMYEDDWRSDHLLRNTADIESQVGQNSQVTQAVARAALTLIYPGREELADRMPTAPLADERILIITDSRTVRECPTCSAMPLLTSTALQDIMLRLYGPSATGQVIPNNIQSLTFSDLNRLLAEPAGQEPAIEEAIERAKWIVFAQLDYNPEEYPESGALRSFLAKRSDSLRDKRLVVMAFSAPYYLDTTEISKLTAYFGIYSKTAPFLEAAVRALFREFTPVGAPPVSVTGINYELIRQLEPSPGQIVPLVPIVPADVISSSIRVGSQVVLETGVILDRKGHAVPDGTPVEFHLLYPAEGLALAPKVETTIGGKAHTTVVLDRPGDLWITAQAGEAKDSTRVELKVGGDTPGSIATVVPTPTPLPTATPSPTPLPTSTLTPTPVPSPTPSVTSAPPPPPPKPRVAWPAFLFALAGTLTSGGAAFAVRRRRSGGGEPSDSPGAGLLAQPMAAALWAGVAAWTAYVLYAVGWLPGSTQLQTAGCSWAAGALTLIAGMLTLLWNSGWQWGRQDRHQEG